MVAYRQVLNVYFFALYCAVYKKSRIGLNNYYPNKEAAMGIIVVSLPCTAYQCGSLTAFE